MGNDAIECHGLSRQFGARMAVSDLEFSVPSGIVFGFLGPNGAGKTTTVRLMVGMLQPSSGSLRVLGHDPVAEGEWVRTRCGVMLDGVGLYDRLSARRNLEFAARIARLNKSEGRQRVDASLQRVGLWDRREDRVSGFSKGMRQKLGLARALIADPEMLILDEPTAGLDPANIVMVRELLLSLAEDAGRSVFLCTHLLAEAQRICDQVAIIRGGRLLAMGEPNKLGEAQLPSVRLTLSGYDGDSSTALNLPQGAQMARLSAQEWRATLGDPQDIEALVAALVAGGVGVRAVIPEQVSLEEEYMRLVGGNADE